MTIPLEKILTISAKEYCEMNGQKLLEYNAIGVHCASFECFVNYIESKRELLNDMIKKFAENVPSETEVVVDYGFSISTTSTTSHGTSCLSYLGSGTALIPKSFRNKINS